MAARKTSGRKTGKSKTNGRKNTGSKKKSTVKKTTAARTRNKKPVESAGIAGDIILAFFLLLALLLFVFNLGVGGSLGNKISGVMFGIFGLFAYVVPFYIFFAIAFFIANRKNSLIVRKMIGLFLLLIFICAVLQLITVNDFSKGTPLSDYYYMSTTDHTGGGFIGGALVHCFTFGFSIVVAWVVTIFGLVISLIVLTQRPLLSNLGHKTKRTAEKVRARRMAAKEAEEEDDDLEYDEEDMASANAMKRARRLRKFPIFNLLLGGDDDLYDDDYDDEEEDDLDDIRPARRARREHASEEEEISDEIKDSEEKSAETQNASVKSSGKKKSVKSQAGGKKRKTSGDGSGAKAAKAASYDDSKMPAFLRTVTRPGTVPEAEKEDLKTDAVIMPDEQDGEEKEPSIMIEGMDLAEEETTAEKTASADDAQTAEKPAAEEKTPAKRSSVKKAKSREEEITSNINTIKSEISTSRQPEKKYVLPSTDLLTRGKVQAGDSRQHLLETAQKLEQIFRDFGVNVHVNNVSRGPTVTRYELTPEQGVKVSRIVSLTDDIKLNLAASEIRIEAPIPGKAAVGIEVPNKESSVVAFRDLVESNEFKKSKAPLSFAVGKDIAGKPVISDIAKMPHLLIAGATGSGKSVCINTLIMSVLMKSTPDEVRMLMIDPKVVELKIYDGIPHLLIPVVTDPKKAAGALNWAVQEMNDRYNKFAEYTGVRDLKSYNKRVEKINEALPPEEQLKKLPQILIIVDELADLMMVAPGEVEDAICRLAQLARAAGLHLVIATQRPSVNVVTGLIKANMPSRIALAVSSGVDSRTIIDMNGAEKLLGHGDMLFAPQGYPKPARVQGAYISDDDISRVVKYLSQHNSEIEYNSGVEDEITRTINNSSQASGGNDSGRDEYFTEAGRFIIEKDKASIGMLQRMFKIGFNRAARIMDQLCEAGVVGPEEGTKPRKILMDAETFESVFGGES